MSDQPSALVRIPGFNLLRLCGASALALLGSFIILLNTPLELLFTPTTPTGGDNPAHPVLIKSLSGALSADLSIIHYSYDLWAGFELFQFYFPLPYLIGALVAQLIEPKVAYKLFAVAPLFLLPPAMFLGVRFAGGHLVTAGVGSLLAVSFLHTQGFVVWGGNAFSTLAGMVANGWAFVIGIIALGLLSRARMEKRFSLAASVAAAATLLSHFYVALFLAMFGFSIFIVDLWLVWKGRERAQELAPFYLNAVAGFLLSSWWLIPLMHYRGWAADFGGDWNWSFLDSLTRTEVVAAGLCALLTCTLFFKKIYSPLLVVASVFLLLQLFLISARGVFSEIVFSNIRLWPGLYMSGYLLLIALFETVFARGFRLLTILMFLGIGFLIPSEEAFRDIRGWMTWNMSGVEAKQGGGDFAALVSTLRNEPKSRVSFESSDRNNKLFGTVREFELLPWLTDHNIIEGGIVNSATLPGIPYFLQCLMSNTCAGWPRGSIMPEKDIEAGAEMMRALGVDYHIAAREENQRAIEASGRFEKLFQGRFTALYKRNEKSPMVEVFDGHPMFVSAADVEKLILFLPAFDDLRNQAIAVLKAGAHREAAVDPMDFVNYLTRLWYSGRHLTARGWTPRLKEARRGEVVTYFNIPKAKIGPEGFDISKPMEEVPSLFIASRSYEPYPQYYTEEWMNFAVVIPLAAKSPGVHEVNMRVNGYRALANGREMDVSKPIPLEFRRLLPNQEWNSFAAITLLPIGEGGNWGNFIDHVYGLNEELRSMLPSTGELSVSERITERCDASVEERFHRLILSTSCPGKPHLLKYSYYPKWQAEVPIYRGVNGFMLLVPQSERTEVVHRDQPVDKFAKVLTMLGVLLCVVAEFWRRRRAVA